MRDKVPVLVYLDREVASAFQKRFPRTASQLFRKAVDNSLRYPNFLHDLLYCDYDNSGHSFYDFLSEDSDV